MHIHAPPLAPRGWAPLQTGKAFCRSQQRMHQRTGPVAVPVLRLHGALRPLASLQAVSPIGAPGPQVHPSLQGLGEGALRWGQEPSCGHGLLQGVRQVWRFALLRVSVLGDPNKLSLREERPVGPQQTQDKSHWHFLELHSMSLKDPGGEEEPSASAAKRTISVYLHPDLRSS